jgi:hypothetical protein
MNIMRRVALASAAALLALSAAQAADLPVKANPVEYVRVCSLYVAHGRVTGVEAARPVALGDARIGCVHQLIAPPRGAFCYDAVSRAPVRRSLCNVHNAPRCASSTNCHRAFARSASVSATASRRYLCARVSARVGVIRGPVWQSGIGGPFAALAV